MKEKKEREKKLTSKISKKGVAQSAPFIGINIFITKQLSMKNPKFLLFSDLTLNR